MMASFDTKSPLLLMALPEESQGLFEAAGLTPLYTGIGQVKAATALARALSKAKPPAVLNLGTAGSFSIAPGTCVECSAFVQRQFDRLGLRSRKIQAASKKTELTQAVCGTADFVQFELFPGTTEFDVMDMEAYALAYVAQQFQIPFYSIKYITDKSDQNIVEEWKRNLKHGAEELLRIYQLNSFL